jgi:nudix-type nucleoside diphosphatase (YffH/AdpP family)
MRGGHGVHLGHNDRVDNLDLEVLSDHWYVLRKATFDYRHRDGRVTREVREAYDRGNGVTILLHDPQAGTVILTRQFRLPIYLNGHPDGMLIEAAAGLLDAPGEDPEEAIRREAEEESGVRVTEVRRLFELFMSPGSVTEQVTFFAATYSRAQLAAELLASPPELAAAAGRRRSPTLPMGGGKADEGEDIEVLELTLDDALAMVARGEIDDGKTVILLQWAALQRAR